MMYLHYAIPGTRNSEYVVYFPGNDFEKGVILSHRVHNTGLDELQSYIGKALKPYIGEMSQIYGPGFVFDGATCFLEDYLAYDPEMAIEAQKWAVDHKERKFLNDDVLLATLAKFPERMGFLIKTRVNNQWKWVLYRLAEKIDVFRFEPEQDPLILEPVDENDDACSLELFWKRLYIKIDTGAVKIINLETYGK